MPLPTMPISQGLASLRACLVATRTGALIAVIGSGLWLGLPAPAYADEEAEEAGRIAEVRVFSQPRESVQDAALAEVRGRGGLAERMDASAALAVILWDETKCCVMPNTRPPTGAAYESAGAVTVTYRGGVQ
jgi:hypothetical protein